MNALNAQEIRNQYLKFYSDRQHEVIARAPLILKDDPTTLFTGSGMQPLLPFLLGQPHPAGARLVDSQTCLRAQDIEDVGDNRHTTFFEMLGNWSMGDYFKEQQIRWFFEFLTDVAGVDPEKIYVTCFIGDETQGIPRDTEAAEIWQKVFQEKGLTADIAEIGSAKDGDERGIKPGERIFYYDDGENWWSRGGGLDKTPIGDPCGPDSEVFYDFGPEHHAPGYGLAHPASDSGQFMEIGNQVFMQYRRLDDGSFEPLATKNVDFGGGLERIAAAANKNPDVYRISLLWPIVEKLQQLSGKKYESHTESMRVIADHLRGATFLAVDGAVPANKEQGYVMRRLLRRAIRFAFDLGIEQNFLEQIVPVIADLYSEDYPEVKTKRDEVIAVLVKEEKVFRQTLRKGLSQMQKFSGDGLTGAELFTLYDTFGFPVELSTEEAYKQEIKLSDNWRQEFDDKMAEQRARSQTAAKGTFKGGLGGQTIQHKKYHTATHLMYAALKKVVGDHVTQHGSNITEERLRFDFNNDEKVTREQLDEVEKLVNEWISWDLPVSFQEYPTDQAFGMGAIGAFGDKYGDTVKVYKMGDEPKRVSFEICGGPHVDRTSQLAEDGKVFKITKEESSSAGIRRIKAVLV
ncbi:alanine--tRNA ligase [Candidatus Saccharibacteria bacterium RIFCSPHIGHO2_01_FULL_45_15]|nr:MAG: alanine--tRNA ligase [Candidatus Saccharibacteria bacterium RIFCSPHIGHO2_01_FULL_45_15]OGL31811.1 MAG: alanine--tRNA ligase [Candidatus Saccharibacteria bacterium RIFCSPHIGHO2_12_FULL_44_22]